MALAHHEVNECGSSELTPEHFLLALLREESGKVARLFDECQLLPEDVREDLEDQIARRPKSSELTEIPFNKSAVQVLQLAQREAENLRHDHIGTEHLLLGILAEGTSIAASVLIARGLHLDLVRQKTIALNN
jgi:ATP-dependent Clp protease ATP-binding subunit ClpC